MRNKITRKALYPLVASAGAALSLICSSCGDDSELYSGEWAQGDRRVRENMRTVQVAAEKYAANHGGKQYPTTIDDQFKTYFPGGLEGARPAPVGPPNPFSGENEFPKLAARADVEGMRRGTRFELKAGVIEYSPINNGQGYAIVGGAHDGKALMDEHNPDQVLVFSNL